MLAEVVSGEGLGPAGRGNDAEDVRAGTRPTKEEWPVGPMVLLGSLDSILPLLLRSPKTVQPERPVSVESCLPFLLVSLKTVPETKRDDRALVGEVDGGDGLAGGEGDVIAKVVGGGDLIVAGGEDLADDVGSGDEAGEGIVAGGVGGGFWIAGFEGAGIGGVDVDGDAGDSAFAGVELAVAVGVVEDDAEDGGLEFGCADVDGFADDAGETALIGGDARGDEAIVAGVDGGAAGEGDHGVGWGRRCCPKSRAWGY